MTASNEAIRDLYERRASTYDLTLAAYLLTGFRAQKYRRDAIAALALVPGAVVIDLGCGTGLNLPMLQAAIGCNGRIIGVDIADAMLEEARRRVTANRWRNVELVLADLADYVIPHGVDAILSTFAITLTPAYDDVIRRAAGALRSGGRFAIVDLKKPAWPLALIRVGAWLYSPFGVSLELADRHPWCSVRRYLREIECHEYYFGGAYLTVGRAGEQCNKATGQRSA